MPARKNYLFQIPRIHDGLQELLANDPVFSGAGVTPRDIRQPYYGTGFPGLVRIVMAQQISTAAADALWDRLHSRFPRVSPDNILALNADDMRLLGMSHQKARAVTDLARAVKSGAFVPEALDRLPDDKIIDRITALRGFGPWSAQIYLMFGLARPDVWPADDLGIRQGLQHYLGVSYRPDPAQARKYGTQFQPHRTAAALLLWHIKSCRA